MDHLGAFSSVTVEDYNVKVLLKYVMNFMSFSKSYPNLRPVTSPYRRALLRRTAQPCHVLQQTSLGTWRDIIKHWALP